MNRLKNIHPGEVLREEFLLPLRISATKLAQDLSLPFEKVQQLIEEKDYLDKHIAMKLSKYFGTSSGFWLGLQNDFDFEKRVNR